MSAIFGFFRIDGQPIHKETINVIVKKTSWWTPHKVHQLYEENRYFAHLASAQDAPLQIISKHKNYPHLSIVVDARIDNKTALVKQFNELKTSFTDVEIILWLYYKFGKDCVKHLIGAFAFAVWDDHKKELFIARDHFGIKSIHYYLDDKIFAFATQKKSIVHHPEINKYPDWIYLVNRFYRNDVQRDATEYKHVKQLIPAHYLVWKNKDLNIQSYWSFDTKKTTFYKDENQYIEHFEELFLQAVDRRLQRSTKTGSHLSGGLDSSGISSVAQHLLTSKYNREIETFSYTIHESMVDKVNFKNENPLVDAVVEFANITTANRIDTPTYRKIRHKIIQEATIFDGFSRSQNLDVEWELLLKAKERGIDTMLSGFPGDELVTSFARMYFLEYLERGDMIRYFNSKFKGKRDIPKLLAPLGVKIASYIPGFNAPSYFGYQYNTHLQKKHKNNVIKNGHYFNQNYINNNPDLQKALEIQYFNTHHENFPLSLKEYQANHICRLHTCRRIEAEKLAALHFNIEYRYPMLDLDLVSYVLSLPVEQKIAPDMTRRIYRRGMKPFLPDSVRLRDDKNGSLKPLASYLRPFKDGTGKQLLEEAKQANATDFLDVPRIELAISEGWRPDSFFYLMVIAKLVIDQKMSL